MKFTSVKLDNFLSFEEAELSFEDQGLVFVKGENLDSTSANGNGSGKSALVVEALLWVLFGKTARGITGEEILRRGARSGGVCVEWQQDEAHQYRIIRKQIGSKGSLVFQALSYDDNCTWIDFSATDKRRTQQDIEETLGFDFNIALYSLVLGQNSLSFADSTDAAKKTVFETVLNFDQLKEAEKRAREKVGLLSSEEGKLTNSTTLLGIQITEKETQIGDQATRIEQWEQQRQHDVTNAEMSLQILKEQDKERNLTLFRIRVAKACIEEGEIEYKKKNELDWQREELYSNIRHLETTTSMVEEALGRLQLTNKPNMTCPRCNQMLPPAELEKEKQRLREDKKSAQKYRDEIDKNEKKLKSLQVKLKSVQEAIANFVDGDEVSKYKVLLSDLQRKVPSSTLSVDIATCEANIKHLSEAINPIEETIKVLKHDLINLQAKLANAQEEIKKIILKKKYLDFWVTGFGKKGLQSFLLDAILPILTQRVQEYAEILCGGEIQISFDTTSQTKGGKIRDDFTVKCINRNGAENYKGQSGGERNRIDTVVALALQDLVLSRLGTDMNFGVFDETVTHIDSEGAERMMKLLIHLKKKRPTIFFVSHDTTFESYFPKQLRVVKENGISRLEEN